MNLIRDFEDLKIDHPVTQTICQYLKAELHKIDLNF
jgi:hypothetical protein